jgi:tetratricopeptide (TPR) repeat protein
MTRMRLLLALLLATPAMAQQGPPAPDPALSEAAMLDRRRYDGCVRALDADAGKAEQFAREWGERGGGLPARHCQALAQLKQQNYAAAATTLAAGAREADAAKSPHAADFWGQAGNAAFLAGDSRGAVAHFTAALAAAGPFAPQRSAALHIDRARAQAELGDFAATRADLDRALSLHDSDAVAWMLSAALARRQGDMARATREIARASTLAPTDPDIMFEQANIAAANGDIETAKKVWAMTVRAAPNSPAAELAAEALKRN